MLASSVIGGIGVCSGLIAQQNSVGVEELGQSLAHGHLIGGVRELGTGHQFQQTHAELKLLFRDGSRRIRQQEWIELEAALLAGRRA